MPTYTDTFGKIVSYFAMVTKEPFDVKADKFHKVLMTDRIAAEALKLGAYVAAWYDTLIIAPPLIITEEQVDEGVGILDKALEIADREVVPTDIPGARSTQTFIRRTP